MYFEHIIFIDNTHAINTFLNDKLRIKGGKHEALKGVRNVIEETLQENSGRIDKTCPNQGVLNYGNLTKN
jgi:hypothetical protein